MNFRKAERKKAKLRLAICGPAGSGKTYSALLMAQGLAPGAIEEARKGMERRQRALERHADRLRQYLKAQIERTGMGKIKNHYLALRIQNNPPSVVVDDEKSIPAEYKRTETVTTLLRAEIARALKADEEVPGSHLQRSTRLVIQ